MRSRAELRSSAEWLLRAALLATLAIALWRSMRPVAAVFGTRATSTTALARDLDAVVADPTIHAVDVGIDAMPSRTERDVLIALRKVGLAVRWNGSPPALAIEAVRVREPDDRARLLVAGGGTVPMSVVDSAGLLDTIRAKAGATVDVASIVGAVRVEHGKFAARAVAPAGESTRAVL
ncbi:MAG: hypothetical protein ABI969_11305, partial [bacterium]